MVQTGVIDNIYLFRNVEHIKIEDMEFQVFGYFVLWCIGNVNAPLKIALLVPALQNLSNNNQQEIQKFHDRVLPDIIAKEF